MPTGATETKKTLDESELASFTGSENWYQHWLGKTLYTDGAKFVADQAGAYWLVDEIAIAQTRPKVRAEEFQVWTLKVDLEKHAATLTCDDGNGNVVFTKRIGEPEPFELSAGATSYYRTSLVVSRLEVRGRAGLRLRV